MEPDLEKLKALRHWLHAHPEISRAEQETAEYLRGYLKENSAPDQIIPLDGAGFAAVYEGSTAGKTVLIRCELDALPIHETNDDIPYRSLYDGVGHKCGHDGHMTILAGLAQLLKKRPARGRVVLLFQPDEETGTGARNCCNHANFGLIEPDWVFALHNLPGYPKGEVICRMGTFASHVKYAAIRMTGKEAHSAQPETGAGPYFALPELTLKAREIQKAHDRPEAYALVVPVYTQTGVQASGVCPARGEVHFTLRASESKTVATIWAELSDHARRLADHYGLDVEFETREEFAATSNSKAGFDMIRQATDMAGLNFRQIDLPFRWGEDFGELTSRYQGGMFGLGAGENRPDLHNPDYDFPDDILESGITMFAALIDIALGNGP